MRSFVVVCNELGISNFESMNVSGAIIGGITIEQWADMNKKEFAQNSQNISADEKLLLAKYLKKCEELLS